jgi:hypothetical protein
VKNPHAVALGRLGGVKGGVARAKALTPRRRRQIAKHAAAARALAMSPSQRQAVARRAAAARWSKSRILTAAEAPAGVRTLLSNYDLAQLRWAKSNHRYVIVREVLLRGDDRAVSWLRGLLFPREMRDLIRRYRGAGCNEVERRKLRAALHLTVDDISARADLESRWRAPVTDPRSLS